MQLTFILSSILIARRNMDVYRSDKGGPLFSDSVKKVLGEPHSIKLTKNGKTFRAMVYRLIMPVKSVNLKKIGETNDRH